MSEHIVPKRTYFTVFGALIAMTVTTVVVARIDLGRLNAIAALSIAVFKGTLVVLYFMHVRYSSKLTWVFVLAGFFWLAILIAFTLSDFLTRPWQQLPI